MTNASAMTLVLLLFVAIILAAVVVILFGGEFFRYATPPKGRKRGMEHPQRAA